MNTAASDWNFYRAFLAVIEQGNLSAAARALNLSQPTVGRQISALEESVGERLFVRSKHGLRPTDASRRLLPHARAMLEAMGAAQRAVSGHESQTVGSVRLTANATVGSEVLPAILVGFRKLYPAITIELVLTNRHQDILAGEADIAIRMARPTQEALIAQRICEVDFGFYAHRDFIARSGGPKNFKDFRHYSGIGFDREDAGARTLGVGLSRGPFA